MISYKELLSETKGNVTALHIGQVLTLSFEFPNNHS